MASDGDKPNPEVPSLIHSWGSKSAHEMPRPSLDGQN